MRHGANRTLTIHEGNTVVVIGSILVGEQIVDAVQMRVV
jgi:hypothetical protein